MKHTELLGQVLDQYVGKPLTRALKEKVIADFEVGLVNKKASKIDAKTFRVALDPATQYLEE